jgi:hypothetical protein
LFFSSSWNIALDIDARNGYGPETISIASLISDETLATIANDSPVLQ